MPTYTVTASGGTRNWNDQNTWTTTLANPNGPQAGDDIIVPAGAGNLTVNLNSSCLTITFQTGYNNTFTIANGITLTVFGNAITLSSGMNYNQGTTGVLSTLGNQTAVTITFAGITIPRLTLGKATAGTIQTVTISGTTPTIRNLLINNGAGNAVTTLSGTAITITSSLSVTGGVLTNNTGQIIFSGTCTINCSTSSNTIGGGFNVTTGSSLQMLSNIYLQTGTVTFTGTATLNTGTFGLFCPAAVTFNTSTVTWYDVTLSSTGQTYSLLSNLNISNNLTITTGGSGVVITGNFSVNIFGSLLNTAGNGLALGPTTIINMLGTGTIETVGTISSGTININGSGNYVLSSVSRPTLTLIGGITLNLVGTSTASVFNTSSHTLSLSSATINTNNTSTGANVVGGSQIIWGNVTGTSNTTITFGTSSTYENTILGNLSVNSNTINGGKLLVNGNLSVTTGVLGTATIELVGSNSTTWGAGTYQNSITVNKSGGASVTLPAGTITWGAANRTLNLNTATNFTTNNTTLILAGTPLTISNASNSQFWNLTTSSPVTTQTINLN